MRGRCRLQAIGTGTDELLLKKLVGRHLLVSLLWSHLFLLFFAATGGLLFNELEGPRRVNVRTVCRVLQANRCVPIRAEQTRAQLRHTVEVHDHIALTVIIVVYLFIQHRLDDQIPILQIGLVFIELLLPIQIVKHEQSLIVRIFLLITVYGITIPKTLLFFIIVSIQV